ncbi:MAG: type II secretion system F family protein [bacterium]|nr:type II secretion system F family protein [bacterium]
MRHFKDKSVSVPVIIENLRMDLRIRGRKWSLRETAHLCRQMSVLLKAGVSASEMILVCQEAAQSKMLRRTLDSLSQNVQKGMAVSQAMREQKTIFPPLLADMVENGELSGRLDEVLEKMAEYYEKEVVIQEKLKTALIYPSILFAVSLFSCVFLLTFVMPQIFLLFDGEKLPALTRVMQRLSLFLVQHGAEAFLCCLIFAGVFSWASTKKAFAVRLHQAEFFIPIFGGLLKTANTARFALAFAILYGSGIDILTSLNNAGKILKNKYARQCLSEACEEVRKGYMLSACLKKQKIWEPVFCSMVRVGEESGSLEQILEHIGDFFQKETEQAADRMIALLEPMLILVMGALVGVIVLAVMLPVFEMYNRML